MNKFVVIDLETTGQSPDKGDRIIEVGIVVIKNDEIHSTYSTLINPEQPIPPFITNLTNISDTDVKNAPLFKDKSAEMVELFKGAYFVAHNVPFDLRFLNYELQQVYMTKLNNPTIDTVEISRILYPQAPSYKLQELAEFLNIDHETPHRALEDAMVTAKILLQLRKKFTQLPYETIDHLLNLEKYFHSDLYDLIVERHKLLAFQTEENPTIVTHQGLAFRQPPEEKVIDDNKEESFGYLLDYVYEENGTLANTLNHYEKRTGQREISELIYDAFRNKKHGLIEAGTGTGKTLAYLIPAVYKAITEDKPIVLSTYTTQLQSQLLYEEIPLLRKIVPFTFNVAMLKGQRHYLSLERFLYELTQENTEDNYDTALTKAMILVWITETETGDIDEIQLSKSGYYFFRQISTETEEKINPKSPWFRYSYYIHAKNKAHNAHIIVTNHALLSADLYNDFGLIPSYQYAIIDEAHHFERAVSNQSALSIDDAHIQYTLNQLGTTEESKRIANLVHEYPLLKKYFVENNWNETYDDIKLHVSQLFEAILVNVKNKQVHQKAMSDIGRIQYRTGADVENDSTWRGIKEIANNVIFMFTDLIRILKNIPEMDHGLNIEIEQFKQELNHHVITLELSVDSLKSFFSWNDDADCVKWIEIEGREKVYLYEKPINIADYLRESFFDKKASIVFTSATLTMRSTFSHILDQLGLKNGNVITEKIDSPYNYEEQVKFMVPNDFPNIVKDEEEFIYSTCEAISSMAEITKGRMLVLFTSYRMLRKSYYLLQETIDIDEYMLVAQGITSGSRSRLTKNFQSFPKAILLGTSSFWEGVDIPGEDLSSLMIVRLPFQPPNHPVYEAKANELEMQGDHPFFKLALPEAVIRFKQGFGRLIRSHKDRGVVFVCDSRIITAKYGSFFTKSIPNLNVHYDTTSELMKKLKEWF